MGGAGLRREGPMRHWPWRRRRRADAGATAALAALLAACSGGEGGPGSSGPVATTATVRVTIATTGVGLDPDGYTLTLVGGESRPVGPDDTAIFRDLPPGAYTFQLSGLAPNCAVSSEAGLDIQVSAGETGQVVIDVGCGYFLYVGNLASDDVSVLQTVTHEPVETVAVGNVSDDVTATPDGGLVYFTQVFAGSSAPRDTVGVLSTETNELVDQVLVRDGPWRLAVAPDGEEVYVLHLTSAELTVVDVASQMEVDRIPLGPSVGNGDIAVSSDGTRAYVPVLDADGVAVIDLEARTVEREIALDDPIVAAPSPDDAVLYVGVGAGMLHAIDLSTDAVMASYDATGLIDDLAVSADGSTVYLALREPGFLVSVDGATLVQQEIISLPDPSRIALTPDDALLYVTNTLDDVVAAVSTSPLSLLELAPVGDGPRGLAVVPP